MSNKDTISSDKNEIFRCPNGWFLIVNTVLELMIEAPSEVMVTQIEEIEGSLRVTYTQPENDDCDYIIGVCDLAEHISRTACSICGQQGQVLNTHYSVARCSFHNVFDFFDQEDISFKKIPFKVNNFGKRLDQMINILYERVLAQKDHGTMPSVKFERIVKENDKLCIDYSGGNKMTQGMVDLLLYYSLKVDDETGQVITGDNY